MSVATVPSTLLILLGHRGRERKKVNIRLEARSSGDVYREEYFVVEYFIQSIQAHIILTTDILFLRTVFSYEGAESVSKVE